jgi:hypothetical protein
MGRSNRYNRARPLFAASTDVSGHYTAAIVANPDDAIPYTNRAAAYLKLDK